MHYASLFYPNDVKIPIFISVFQLDRKYVIVPTSEGVTLTLRRYITLIHFIDSIKTAFQDDDRSVIHIGGKFYIVKERNEQHVTLARFPGPPEDCNPTSECITLSLDDITALNDMHSAMVSAVPEIMTVTPCFLSDDHQAQYGFMMCSECNPFPDIYDF